MDRAYLREIQHSNQCELAFYLKLDDESDVTILETHIRSVRQLGDSVGSLIQHTKNKIKKLLDDDEQCINKLNASFIYNDSTINADIICSTFISRFYRPISPIKSDNLIFNIGKQSFIVAVNAPLITALTLPDILYVGHFVQPAKFKTLFTEKRLSSNTWFTSTDKIVWEEVGRNYKYKPTIADSNKHLKLVCIPRNAKLDGPPFEVVSTSTIQKMCSIPKCPFEERHKCTTNRLSGSKLRIVSYNTLSNLYCYLDQFPYCKPEFLSIDYRKQLILKELQGYHADIICLQELDFHIYNHYLLRKLSKQYQAIFLKKGKCLREGSAIFYSSTRFKLLKSMNIVLAEELQRNPLFSWIWNLLQSTPSLKDNVIKPLTSLQLGVLKVLNTTNVIIVANTHLYYHAEGSDIRLIQGSVALGFIADFVHSYKRNNPNSKVAVIFCGDFNSNPESSLYTFFTKRVIERTLGADSDKPIEDVCFKHLFTFGSAYDNSKYTNYTGDFKGCLDYIFYETDKIDLIKTVPLPDEEILSKNVALPSAVFPSDHLALVAELQM